MTFPYLQQVAPDFSGASLIEKHDFVMTFIDSCKRKNLWIAPQGVEPTVFCSQGRRANPHAMNALICNTYNPGDDYKITMKSVEEIS